MAASKIFPERAQVSLLGGYEESSSRSTRAIIHNYELLIIEVRLDESFFYFHCKEIPSIISLIGSENLCVLKYDAVFLN